MAVPQNFPYIEIEVECFCREEWKKLPNMQSIKDLVNHSGQYSYVLVNVIFKDCKKQFLFWPNGVT